MRIIMRIGFHIEIFKKGIRMYQSSPSPEQPQHAFLNINLNSPPYVPQRGYDPRLQNIAPVVSAALAMELQAQANNNPLRMFAFNQCAENYFQNAEFDSLCTFTLNYIALTLMKGSFRSEEEAMNNIVPAALELFVANNVRAYDFLRNYIDGNIFNDVMQSQNKFDFVLNEIRMMTQGGGGYNMGNGFNGSRYGNSFNYNAGPRATASGNRGGGFPTGFRDTGNGFSNNLGKTGLFARHGNQPEERVPEDRFVKPIILSSKREETPANNLRTVTHMEQNKQQNKGKQILVPSTDGSIKWKRTPGEDYKPAYNPYIDELFYVVDSNKKLFGSEVSKRKEPVMDYARHEIQLTIGNSANKAKLRPQAEVEAALAESIAKVNEITSSKAASLDEVIPASARTIVNNILQADVCLNGAIMMGNVDRQSVENEGCLIYKSYFVIADPYISPTSEAGLINEMLGFETFNAVAKFMKEKAAAFTPALWNGINTKLTSAINRILCTSLSIPKSELSIESFVTDIDELMEILKEDYGGAIFAAINRRQKDFIQDFFQKIDKIIIDLLDIDIEGKDLKISYLFSNFTITHLDLLPEELGVQLDKEVACNVSSITLPNLHSLLESIMADTLIFEGEFVRHLIVLKDGRKLELSRGWLNQSETVYLLSSFA